MSTILSQFFYDPEIPIIVEVGVGHGIMLGKYLVDYQGAKIYAFEPEEQLYNDLEEKYSDNADVKIYPYALGAVKHTTQFNVNDRLIASSLFKRTPDSNQIFKTTSVETIECRRLDSVQDLIDLDHIDLLNIITEGSELGVLIGSTALLPKTNVITVQMFFHPVYIKQTYYYSVDRFLRNNEFRFFKLYETATLPNGQLARIVAVYVKGTL